MEDWVWSSRGCPVFHRLAMPKAVQRGLLREEKWTLWLSFPLQWDFSGKITQIPQLIEMNILDELPPGFLPKLLLQSTVSSCLVSSSPFLSSPKSLLCCCIPVAFSRLKPELSHVHGMFPCVATQPRTFNKPPCKRGAKRRQ